MRIEVRDKSFGDVRVLGHISIEVPKGTRLAITGPSGVGKSTLMRIIAGLDQTFEGTIQGVGRIGMVFQEPTLLPWRTALRNITIPTRCADDAALSLLSEVGLEGRHDAYPGNLSLGQQRRLALARAFAASPDVFLMDEAFASLDEATADRMRDLTRRLLNARMVTAIIVTHDPSEAVALADRVIGINGTPGRIVFDHMVSELEVGGGAVAELRQLIREGTDQN